MIRDYELEYSENGIEIEKGFKPETKTLMQDLIDRHYKVYQDYILFACIVLKYMRVKGDMLVMENISRKKHKEDFEEMEKFLNEYKRQHQK